MQSGSLQVIISDVMSAEMSALVFHGPGRMVLEPRPRPIPGNGDVVLAVSAAGICGSELTSFTGDSTRRAAGRVFGHEIAGTVGAVGPHAPSDLVGQRVVVNPLMPCGRCAICVSGQTNACPNRTLLGMQIDGGFAEEVVVPAAALRKLDELEDVGGTLVEPLANAVHVVQLLPRVIGENVLVFGAGAIGLCVVTVLRRAGAGKITVVDPVGARREMALDSGAHEACSPGEGPNLGEAGHVVDAAGVTSSRRDAIMYCAPGGCIILLGLHTAESELPINAAVAKELRLQCSYAYTQRDFDVALRLLQSGSVSYRPWITELGLPEGQAAFEALVDRPGDVTKIVLRP